MFPSGELSCGTTFQFSKKASTLNIFKHSLKGETFLLFQKGEDIIVNIFSLCGLL